MLRKVKWRKRRKEKERKGGKEGGRKEERKGGGRKERKNEKKKIKYAPGALSSTFPELASWSSIHIGFSSHLFILSRAPSFPLVFRPKHLSWPQFPQPTSNLSESRWLCFQNPKVKALVAQSCQTLCDSVDYSPPCSSVHGILQARIPKWVVSFPSPGALPNQGIEPGSPALQVDSLLSEPPGKSQNIKVYPIHPVLLTNAIILSLTQTRAAAFQVFPPASTSFHVSSLHSNRRSLLITVQKTTVLRVSSCDSKERNWPKTVLKELPGQLLVFSRRKQPERRYLNSPSDKVEFSFQPQFFLHWAHL